MASATPFWHRAFAALMAGVRAQPLATALLFPIALLAVQQHWQRQDAAASRVLTAADNRLGQFQVSGKNLDEALANYFEAVARLGLAERHIQESGSFSPTPLKEAQEGVLAARKEARKAIIQNASDAKVLRGVASDAKADAYMEKLAVLSDIVDEQHDVLDMGNYTTAFGSLVKTRDALVDSHS